MTAGADAQPSGRKPANMPYAEPLQGSTTCNPEGFFSPLPFNHRADTERFTPTAPKGHVTIRANAIRPYNPLTTLL